MSTKAVRTNDPTRDAGVARVDMKFEVVVLPVSDVDRAKEFYARLGWRLDADYDSGKDFRVIQFTPPGSGCAIIFGKNVTPAAPGSAQGPVSYTHLRSRSRRAPMYICSNMYCTVVRTRMLFLFSGTAAQSFRRMAVCWSLSSSCLRLSRIQIRSWKAT